MLLGDAPATGVLPATDFGRARRFWSGVGARELWADEDSQTALFEAGAGTKFMVYTRSVPTKAEHTVLGFDVQDLDSAMSEMRGRGVAFEEYDMPGLKTENGIAQMGDSRGAWFKDSEGNIISVAEGARDRERAGAGVSHA